MTILQWILISLSQLALVAGQIFLKHGMSHADGKPRKTPIPMPLVAGVFMLTCWFFLWLMLLQKLDLSFIYPFEGMSPVLLVLAAQIFLKERLDSKAWIGVLLIAAGTAFVGASA